MFHEVAIRLQNVRPAFFFGILLMAWAVTLPATAGEVEVDPDGRPVQASHR